MKFFEFFKFSFYNFYRILFIKIYNSSKFVNLNSPFGNSLILLYIEIL